MEKLRKFETEETYNNTSLEYPTVAYTEDTDKVWIKELKYIYSCKYNSDRNYWIIRQTYNSYYPNNELRKFCAFNEKTLKNLEYYYDGEGDINTYYIFYGDISKYEITLDNLSYYFNDENDGYFYIENDKLYSSLSDNTNIHCGANINVITISHKTDKSIKPLTNYYYSCAG